MDKKKILMMIDRYRTKKLLKQGYGYADIAKKLDIPESTVRRWIMDFK